MNPEAIESYFRLMTAQGSLRVFQAAVDAGFMASLGQSSKTLNELCHSCGTHGRPTRLVLEALVPLQLISCVDGKYSLGPAAALFSGPYSDLGEKYWTHLPELLKTGEPLMAIDEIGSRENYYREQALSLAWMMQAPAAALAHYLDMGSMTKDISILDVGAGTAVWGLALIQRDAGSRLTALDWPAVLPLAQAQAEKMGLSDRLKLISGNYFEVELPENVFSIVILGNVCHLETEEGNLKLLSRLRDSVKPGGKLLILDVFAGQPAGDIPRTLYELGLALRTREAVVHGSETLTALLQDAGYSDVKFVPVKAPPYVMGLIEATKQ